MIRNIGPQIGFPRNVKGSSILEPRLRLYMN